MKEIGEGHRDAIINYLVAEEGAVQLSEKQKGLLQRWEYADELIRQNEYRREDVARMIMRKFEVSRPTAYQDIVNAEAVFSSSTPLNKRYRIGLRIEFLEMKLNEVYADLQPPPDPNGDEPEGFEAMIARVKKNQYYLKEAAALEKVLAKYYEMYPDIQQKRSPRTVIYNVTQVNNMPAPGDPKQAFQAAARILNIDPKQPNDEL